MRLAYWTLLTIAAVAVLLLLTNVSIPSILSNPSSLGFRSDGDLASVGTVGTSTPQELGKFSGQHAPGSAPVQDMELQTALEVSRATEGSSDILTDERTDKVNAVNDFTDKHRAESAAKKIHVGPGDSISTLLGDIGVSAGQIHRLLQGGTETSKLYRIFPGQVFEADLNLSADADNRLVKLRFEENPTRSIEWTRDAATGDFIVEVDEVEPEVKLGYASESIVKSLFIAGQRSGLGDEIILRLARIFRWDIDFVLDIRAGDAFEVLYESEYVDGEFYRYGEILSARFVNRGKVHTAVRYVDTTGEAAYYAPDGTNLRGAFLRAPVDFTRVSSGFSHKRKHPLFDRVRAHLGVDYAAPTGTPVRAAGKGRVTTVAHRSSSGNYVEIRHAGGIETRYLHLSRFARGLAKGDRVAQGEVIGFVGATGWATGPHLHYEFIENGNHLDPQKVAVIRDSAISEQERIRFLVHMDPLLHHLDGFSAGRMSVAAAQ